MKSIKKIISIFLVLTILIVNFSGCASSKMIDGKRYTTYGAFDMSKNKNPNIEYNIVWLNAILGAVLASSSVLFIPTIYFYGYSLFEPVGKKNGNDNMKGVMY